MNEDVAGNLLFTGTPFTDIDTNSLTVTLSVADGTINATTGGNVTVGGTVTARTFSGSVAALNTYFTTAGNITYQAATNIALVASTSAPPMIAVGLSDGSLALIRRD